MTGWQWCWNPWQLIGIALIVWGVSRLVLVAVEWHRSRKTDGGAS